MVTFGRLYSVEGAAVVAMVDDALEAGHGVGEWDGPENVPSFLEALAEAPLPV